MSRRRWGHLTQWFATPWRGGWRRAGLARCWQPSSRLGTVRLNREGRSPNLASLDWSQISHWARSVSTGPNGDYYLYLIFYKQYLVNIKIFKNRCAHLRLLSLFLWVIKIWRWKWFFVIVYSLRNTGQRITCVPISQYFPPVYILTLSGMDSKALAWSKLCVTRSVSLEGELRINETRAMRVCHWIKSVLVFPDTISIDRSVEVMELDGNG